MQSKSHWKVTSIIRLIFATLTLITQPFGRFQSWSYIWSRQLRGPMERRGPDYAENALQINTNMKPPLQFSPHFCFPNVRGDCLNQLRGELGLFNIPPWWEPALTMNRNTTGRAETLITAMKMVTAAFTSSGEAATSLHHQTDFSLENAGCSLIYSITFWLYSC